MKLEHVKAKIIQYAGLGRIKDWKGEIKYGHGIAFDCPVCRARFETSLKRGDHEPFPPHEVVCWSVGVASNIPPFGRWLFHGTSLDDITLDAPMPAIRIGPPCNSQFLIKDGSFLVL